MTFLNKNYKISKDGFGLAIIEETGRCTADEVTTVENGITRRHEMVPIPNSSGAVLKALDGSQPAVIEVTPSTITTRTYLCVKIMGFVNPLTPVQEAGTYSGSAITTYLIRYQEVGSVA